MHLQEWASRRVRVFVCVCMDDCIFNLCSYMSAAFIANCMHLKILITAYISIQMTRCACILQCVCTYVYVCVRVGGFVFTCICPSYKYVCDGRQLLRHLPNIYTNARSMHACMYVCRCIYK